MQLVFVVNVTQMLIDRSAREAEDREKQAVSKGETLPTEQRFDSNCITPGIDYDF